MPSTFTIWQNESLGPGPIALVLPDDCAGEPAAICAGAVLLAGSLDHTTGFAIFGRDLLRFLKTHQSSLFASDHVAKVQRSLIAAWDQGPVPGSTNAWHAIWDLTREGRWIDLQLLDRQIRDVERGGLQPARNGSELVAEDSPSTDSCATATETQPVRELLRRFLDVADSRLSQARELHTQGDPIALPKYVIPSRPRTPEQERAQQEFNAQFSRRLEQRRLPGTSSADKPVGESVSEPIADDNEPAQSPVQQPPAIPLGHWVEVCADVTLRTFCKSDDSACGLEIDAQRLPALLVEVEKRFDKACATLFKDAEARACFKWKENLIARNSKGYMQLEKSKLQHWLKGEKERLFDAQNENADIPCDAQGRPDLSAERWGFWPACDDLLWAWREVQRTTEIGRLAVDGAPIRPRYETRPRLRSWEPNLSYYRALGQPIFRPRDGHRFWTLRVINLRASCLAHVCQSRGYVAWQSIKLNNYFLRNDPEFHELARRLYDHVSAAERDSTSNAHSTSHFEELPTSDPEQFTYWCKLTKALVDLSPLNLSAEFTSRTLRNDFGLQPPSGVHLQELIRLLGENGLPELAYFWEDAAFDTLVSRENLTYHEGFETHLNTKFVETNSARLRKSQPQKTRYRSRSASGRLTDEGTSARVRRQEVLLLQDEVMIALAHSMRARGRKVVGVTERELVLEIPSPQADEQLDLELRQEADETISGLLTCTSSPITTFADLW